MISEGIPPGSIQRIIGGFKKTLAHEGEGHCPLNCLLSSLSVSYLGLIIIFSLALQLLLITLQSSEVAVCLCSVTRFDFPFFCPHNFAALFARGPGNSGVWCM